MKIQIITDKLVFKNGVNPYDYCILVSNFELNFEENINRIDSSLKVLLSYIVIESLEKTVVASSLLLNVYYLES